MVKLLGLLSPFIGFAVCCYLWHREGGIITRPTSEGKMVICWNSIETYLMGPFRFGTKDFEVFWGIVPHLSMLDRFKLLQMNWVFMSFSSFILASLLNLFI